MLINRLPSILGANRLNISKVSKETGISRTTLTALYYGNGKGVQFDTLNALCMYLNTTVDKIIEFLPFNLSVLNVAYGGMQLKEKDKEQIFCKAYMRYADKWTTTSFALDVSITLSKFHSEQLVDDIHGWIKPQNMEQILSEPQNLTTADMLQRLGFEGQEQVADAIYSEIFHKILFHNQDYDFSPLCASFEVNMEFTL